MEHVRRVALRSADGEIVDPRAHQWIEPACAVDERTLALAEPPVIDIGCGPGRHVLALAERGLVTLGIDITPRAVAAARARGVSVLHRSVFDHVPGIGRWGTALLLDGNIGIGGNPTALLARVAELLRPKGITIVELEPPGAPTVPPAVQLELDGDLGPSFPWARVAADDLGALAREARLVPHKTWHDAGRWFATLARP